MQKSIKSKKRTKPSTAHPAPKPEDYQVVIHWDAQDGCFIATLPAWQNAKTHGATIAEAATNANEVLSLLIRTALRSGEPIPAPQRGHSGKLNLRLPTSMHARLAQEAEREGVSLNQWIVTKLAS